MKYIFWVQFKDIAPLNMKIYRRSSYEKHRLVFIAYVLESLSRNSGLLWDRAPIKGKTTNSFWDTEDLVHFYPHFPNIFIPTNTSKLQFDQENIPPPYKSVFFIPWPPVNFLIRRGDFLWKIRGPWGGPWAPVHVLYTCYYCHQQCQQISSTCNSVQFNFNFNSHNQFQGKFILNVFGTMSMYVRCIRHQIK